MMMNDMRQITLTALKTFGQKTEGHIRLAFRPWAELIRIHLNLKTENEKKLFSGIILMGL